MTYIDMHCDTLMQVLFEDHVHRNLYEAPYAAIDLKRMIENKQTAQFFAAFLPTPDTWKNAKGEILDDESYIAAVHEILVKNVAKDPQHLAMAYSAEDIEENRKEGKVSAVFTMEDGRAVQGKMENLKRFYDLGVRALGLTWNGKNCFGSPNSKDPVIMAEGLTDFGKDAVIYMQQLGMLVDVSHLSEGGFYDVASLAKKPFIASHSNSRLLSPHQRNLSDEQIKVLADHGGVTGINFCPAFLNEDITCKDSTVRLMAIHARHIANVGGIECVGIGSDLDGTHGNMEIDRCEKMGLLFDALKDEGFSEEDIEKIRYRNVLRVMKDAMK